MKVKIELYCPMVGAEIIPLLNESTTRLLKELSRFSYRNFNTSMPEASWSAGQIAEHIFLTDLFIFRLLQGGTEFAARPADEKLPLIRQLFADTTQELLIPDFSKPSDSMKDPVSIQEKISRERHSIIQYLHGVEEDSLCSDYFYPGLGRLTVSEWVWFMVYHTDRYGRELKEIENE